MCNLYCYMFRRFPVIIRELQPMPYYVTHILIIAAVDNTIMKLRCFAQAYKSSQIVFVEITIF
jgi:hypothetical protein